MSYGMRTRDVAEEKRRKKVEHWKSRRRLKTNKALNVRRVIKTKNKVKDNIGERK